MEQNIMKNIDMSTIIDPASLVSYLPGQIVSRTLIQNKAVSITLFAFNEGEEISTHASGGDALVLILDGSAVITIGEEVYRPHKGESIVMPAGVPHAVASEQPFKMMLTVVFAQ
ncbi:MAG: cupin domain-containing protein [Lachnospiraceae bacterium]